MSSRTGGGFLGTPLLGALRSTGHPLRHTSSVEGGRP